MSNEKPTLSNELENDPNITSINEKGHYSPLDLLELKDPDVIGQLNHSVKQSILKILIREETSLKNIAEELDINPGTIKRHLTDLLKAHLILQTYIETNQFNFKIKYYRAKARKFRVAYIWPPG
jgi:DNA-binding MarR family transcriptional regulator